VPGLIGLPSVTANGLAIAYSGARQIQVFALILRGFARPFQTTFILGRQSEDEWLRIMRKH